MNSFHFQIHCLEEFINDRIRQKAKNDKAIANSTPDTTAIDHWMFLILTAIQIVAGEQPALTLF